MSENDHLILIGPPNSGKTTLFNWLTGYKRQVVNYPGSTVDVAFGSLKGVEGKVIDTPGLYHFFPSSPESETVQNLLKDSSKKGELKAVIVVLDATRLSRQLPLLFYLKSLNLPLVLALSMYDLQKKKARLDIDFLSRKLDLPVCPIEGLLGGGVSRLLETTCNLLKKPVVLKNLTLKAWKEDKWQSLLKESKDIADRALLSKGQGQDIGKNTKRADAWLLHPMFGFIFLSLILFSFFSGIFWLAAPFMDFVDQGFARLSSLVLKFGESNLLVDFLANGVVTGFGSFLIFAPQVFILFLGIYVLEDSGYLARAVSLVDGPFSKIGLSGRSLFPFLSGFACAIPAVLSAKSISSRTQRWVTIFVIPFMTCSARLPVYALFLSFLFYEESAWKPGIFMAVLYFLSLFIGVGAAGILNLFLKSETKSSSFLMELPLYRKPVLFNLLTGAWSRTKHFIVKAGPVIFLFSLLMWGAVNFPRSPDLDPSAQIENSYAGKLGQAIEPVFEHIGGDWRTGVSLLSAFVAREVFVSVLAVTLKNTNEENSSQMITAMKQARAPGGGPLFTKASVLALLVFFLFSLQCLSTTGVVYKETGSGFFAFIQLLVLNLMGYVGAVLTYQLML